MHACVGMCSEIDASVTPPQFTMRLEPVTVIKGENTKLCAGVKGDCLLDHYTLLFYPALLNGWKIFDDFVLTSLKNNTKN